MASEKSNGFDFDALEAQMRRTKQVRQEVIDAVTFLWGDWRPRNEALTTSRRFIIAAAGGEVVPVPHERMTLVVPAREEPISGVQLVRIRAPFMVPERKKNPIDTTQPFFEFEHRTSLIARRLLTPDSYDYYVDASDIEVVKSPAGQFFSVRPLSPDQQAVDPTPEEIKRFTPDPTAPSEYDNLRTLLQIIGTYEPDFQDNIPIQQS